MDRELLKVKTLAQQEERKNAYQIIRRGDEIEIDGLTLELVDNFKDAFDVEKLAVRYTPLLAQYDYIVGDISADQLRLKGFYQNSKKVAFENKIMALQDYLYEYVNFGAPYFVLENVNPRAVAQEKKEKSDTRGRKKNQRSKSVTSQFKGKGKVNSSNQKQSKKRSFVIKQK
ncbi:YutD family protein [Leuconostoc palmae]|uniref:YutD family protein n=1 Tax=Leuconostoc palmae TaxID=501487 RepID=UPI001C7CFA0D|nr:YutD family protein [Leuconostoc palmae]